MDPWNDISDKRTCEKSEVFNSFEDNFSPAKSDRLPDSEEYLAILEEKLNKIKSDPNVLRQLVEKREACMQQLLTVSEYKYENESTSLDEPVANSPILRTILPQKQALTQGEIVDLVKYDQLVNEESDLPENS